MSSKAKRSPPPTPSSAPSSKRQCRFRDTGFPSEWIEDYRQGGFHPVHFDDEFKNDRYRVIRKLGYGSFSTVWLAVDNESSGFIALKIMSAKSSMNAEKELAICDMLADRACKDPTANHTMLLLDRFQHTGPNGVHQCLVFGAMGSTAASMREELPENQPRTMSETSRYPQAIAKKILKDALSGLAFLHKNGVVHGDMQPGNMLFGIVGLTSISEQTLRQDENMISAPQRRRDGKDDQWAPKYLARGQSLHEFVDLGLNMTIKLSDFGAAFWKDAPPKSTVTPVALRAPELIFEEGSYDPSIDIWAFGCLIYEFIIGQPLFSVFLIGGDDRKDADDDHILDLIDVLGPLPERLMRKWSRREKWIGPEGERLQPSEEDEKSEIPEENGDDEYSDEFEPDDADGASMDETEEFSIDGPEDAEDIEGQNLPFVNEPLEVQFEKNKPQDINADETEEITTLIRQILKYEPSERPTAEQLLQHPWFKC